MTVQTLRGMKFEVSAYAPTYIYKRLPRWKYWLNKIGFKYEREIQGLWLYNFEGTYICSPETYSKILKRIKEHG